MLILTRKVDEVVVIGEHIKVKVIQIRGKQVRLGIEAPPDLLVLRTEKKLGTLKRRPKPQASKIFFPTNARGGLNKIKPGIFPGEGIIVDHGK